jgi:GT2 family glycosyltransferase
MTVMINQDSRRLMAPSPPKTTAVVVNWNAKPFLRSCIEALLDAQPQDLEILVVDNGSTDGSLDTLVEFGDRIRIIETGQNLGFGTGINLGVNSSRSHYVLVLNPDVVLDSESIPELVKYLDVNPTVGVVGPRLLDESGRTTASCGKAPNIVAEVCRKFLLHLVLPFLKFGRQRPTMPKKMGWVTGACFLVRRKATESVGGFDEAIFMYYEDVDFCLRLQSVGWDVAYLPQATGRHSGGGSSRQVLEKMLLVSESSYRIMIRRHLGKQAVRLLNWLTPVEMRIRTLMWQVVSLILPNLRSEAQQRIHAYRRIMFDYSSIDAGGVR